MIYHVPTNDDREAPEMPDSAKCQDCLSYPCECADAVDYDDPTEDQMREEENAAN